MPTDLSDHLSYPQPLQDKLGKVWFFQKTFCWLTLAWFFTFSSADIRFASEGLTRLQTTKRIEILNGGPRDDLWLGLGGQECPRHDLRRVFGLHRYFGINNYPIDLTISNHPLALRTLFLRKKASITSPWRIDSLPRLSRLSPGCSEWAHRRTHQLAQPRWGWLWWGWWWWWSQWWFWQEVRFWGYVRSRHIVLIFKCSSDFYRRFV